MRPEMRPVITEGVSRGEIIVKEIVDADWEALIGFKSIMIWIHFQETGTIETPEPKPWDGQLNQKILDNQSLIEMKKYFEPQWDPHPQPANQLKYIQSLQSALKDGSNWIETILDRLDSKPTDPATLAVIESNLKVSLQALQSARKFRLLTDISEVTSKKVSRQDIKKFTSIQKEAQIVTNYDKLTLNIFGEPTPILANQLLLIHSLHEAVKDDIYWLDKEIKTIEKGITK